MERELTRERTLAGLARAKADGRLGGRRTVMTPERIKVATRMLKDGSPVAEVAATLGVGRSAPGSATSSERAASGWHDCAMNEQQPSQGGQQSAAASGAQPAPSPPAPRQPLPPDRKAQAFGGGMLAGIGIGIGLAIVMHVIQMASPIGDGINLNGMVTLVLFLVGPIIGLGLGMGLAAAAPERTADSAAPHQATPTDQPPLPSA